MKQALSRHLNGAMPKGHPLPAGRMLAWKGRGLRRGCQAGPARGSPRARAVEGSAGLTHH